MKSPSITSPGPAPDDRPQEGEPPKRGWLDQLFSHSQTGLFFCSTEWRFLDVNPAMCRILGRTARELLSPPGNRAADYQHDRSAGKRLARLAAANGGASGFQCRLADPDGRNRWLEVDCCRVSGDSGQTIGFAGACREISAFKSTERQLRNSEAFHRQVVQSLNESLWVVIDHNIHFFNRQLCRLTGYGEQELAGRDFVSLVHPEDRDYLASNYRKRMASQETPASYSFRLQSKHGETIWVRGSFRQVDWLGSPAVVGLLMDITSQKKAEDDLKEATASYQGLVENAPMGVGVMQDERVVFANPALCDLFEYLPEEFLGLTLSQLVQDEYRDLALKLHRSRVRGQHAPTGYEVGVVTKTGEKRFVQVNAVKITWQGQPATLNFLQDINARLLAETALRVSEEKHRSILAAMEEAYYEADLKGNLTFFNQGLVRMMGYQPEELKDMNFRQVVSRETAAKVYDVFHGVLTSGQGTKAFGWELYGKGGRVIQVECSIGLLWGEGGRAVGFRGLARDVGELKAAEREKSRQERLEAAMATAGAACHELNQPLQSVMSQVELMILKAGEDNLLVGNLRKVLDDVKRMGRVTTRLTNLTSYHTLEYLPDQSILDLERSSQGKGD